jgi:hypothetical protein
VSSGKGTWQGEGKTEPLPRVSSNRGRATSGTCSCGTGPHDTTLGIGAIQTLPCPRVLSARVKESTLVSQKRETTTSRFERPAGAIPNEQWGHDRQLVVRVAPLPLLRWSEVAWFRPNNDSGTTDAHGHTSPSAIVPCVARFVCQRVLTRELLADVAVHCRELLDVQWKECSSTRLLRQPAQHELAVLIVTRRRRRPRGSQTDGVDSRVGPRRKIEHFVEAEQAGCVVAIGQHNDRSSARCLGVASRQFAELVQRDVHGVVQSG